MTIKGESGQGEPTTYYAEPDYAREKLSRGEFVIAYFRGQTFLFIPKPISLALGVAKLRSLADQKFGKEVLDKFSGSSNDIYERAYFMVLPPQQNQESNLVTELVQAIKDAATNE